MAASVSSRSTSRPSSPSTCSEGEEEGVEVTLGAVQGDLRAEEIRVWMEARQDEADAVRRREVRRGEDKMRRLQDTLAAERAEAKAASLMSKYWEVEAHRTMLQAQLSVLQQPTPPPPIPWEATPLSLPTPSTDAVRSRLYTSVVAQLQCVVTSLAENVEEEKRQRERWESRYGKKGKSAVKL